MKIKQLLTALLMMFALSASAQVQLLFMEGGRNVIDRNKKMYWMDGDDDPCYNILNYKKSGNKETFTLKGKENPNDVYNVVMSLDGSGQPVQITLSHKDYGKTTSSVKTTSGSADEDRRLIRYFNGLAGNPNTPELDSPAAAIPGANADAGETVAGKVTGAAKNAFGKVKGIFKKKK